eukprot:11992035-Alexandrium_andersonii.AAC.1
MQISVKRCVLCGGIQIQDSWEAWGETTNAETQACMGAQRGGGMNARAVPHPNIDKAIAPLGDNWLLPVGCPRTWGWPIALARAEGVGEPICAKRSATLLDLGARTRARSSHTHIAQANEPVCNYR